jgi:hypothetical protein
MKWTFKWINDWEYIQSSEFIIWWTDIFNTSLNKNIFCHHVLVRSWIKEKNVKPFFCIAESQTITVFYPLVILKMGILKRLVPAGQYEFDYLEPLFCGCNSLKTIGSFWENFEMEVLKHKKYWDTFKLRGVREEFLVKNSNWQKEEICPGIDLRKYSNFDEYMLTRRSSFRKDTYRQIRRLNQDGDLKFYIYTIDDSKLNYAINEFLRCREDKWKYTSTYRNTIKGIMISSIRANIGQLSVLFLGDIPISWHFGFIHAKIFYYWYPLTNSDFLKYSPGKIHLYYLLDFVFKKSITYFDLMLGDEEYKYEWVNCQAQTYYLYMTSNKFKTKFKFMICNLKNKAFYIIKSLLTTQTKFL